MEHQYFYYLFTYFFFFRLVGRYSSLADSDHGVFFIYLFTYLLLRCVSKDRPDLSSERAPHRDNTATFRQQVISGHKFQSGLDIKTC
jgi:hypothetical protein